jgi:hypothetical protein
MGSDAKRPKGESRIVHLGSDLGNRHHTFLLASGRCPTPTRCGEGGTRDNCQATGEWNCDNPTSDVATPLWPSVGVKPNTWKSWDLESSGTPECSELDSKGKNTSHWSFLGVIGKVLKRRYRKCPRIDNLDICSPSYGQKKGRESNWQFDSRPLKVGNRCLPDVRFECAT